MLYLKPILMWHVVIVPRHPMKYSPCLDVRRFPKLETLRFSSRRSPRQHAMCARWIPCHGGGCWRTLWNSELARYVGWWWWCWLCIWWRLFFPLGQCHCWEWTFQWEVWVHTAKLGYGTAPMRHWPGLMRIGPGNEEVAFRRSKFWGSRGRLFG